MALGAPGAASGQDQDQLDNELARVNVLRLRGQYQEAKEVGLGILKTAPHHADTLSLMGDIALEMGELESAERYYRSALDYNPGSPVETRKLAAIRKRIDDRRAAEMAKKLGLSSGGPQVAIFVVTTLLFVAALGVLAFTMGSRARSVGPPPAITGKIDVAKPAPAPAPRPEIKPDPQPESTPAPEQQPVVAEDALIERAIKDRTSHGLKLLGAISDPRNRSATLTYKVEAPFSKEQLATLAVDSLEAMPEVNRVIVRTTIEGEFAMIGELSREALGKVKAGELAASDALEDFWDRTQTGA